MALDRRRIANLADVLIPGGAGMPSASATGVAGPALDRVLDARDDLLPALAKLAAVEGEPAVVLRKAHASDRDAFEAFVLLVSCAYLLDEDVRASLGYRGQVPQPITSDEDTDLADLLAPVLARGRRELS